MEMKRGLIDPLIENGIHKFILIGENVLNFHVSDELYYEEWYDDIKDDDGWITILHLRDHILNEMRSQKLHYYLNIGGPYNDLLWRKFKPAALLEMVEGLITKKIG
jgi:hypothetical protein